MRFAYPVELVHDAKSREVLIRFPDVPEALTSGRDEAEALREAEDALIAALGGYLIARRQVPRPSSLRTGQRLVALPALVAAKLALHEAMRDVGMSNIALAKRLALSEGAVRRLLDLDHRSHIGQVERALGALGRRLVVQDRDAA